MTAPPHAPASRFPTPWVVAGVAAAVVLALIAYSISIWPVPEPPIPPALAPSAPLPPLTSSPFTNTSPGVAYVGDAACTACHPDHVKSYRQHSMGQSLFTAAEAPLLEQFTPSANNPALEGRFRFQALRDGPRMLHKEWCQDEKGAIVASVDADVAFIVGSGAHARSYIHARDGFLFQSPLTWYTQKNRWDLSPGYEHNLLHFERSIDPRCLYCHSQGADAVPHSANRYREPVFAQRAIGCERCHGPGKLHVDARVDGMEPEGVDRTIVNPRHLDPALRENVCEQCHLQGEAVVVRRGRAQAEYRPGLPLHEYVNIFVRQPGAVDAAKIVGHVEQMHLSACFNKSGGKFGCTSCHDPHSLPPPEKKIEFYRQRCMKCHEQEKPLDDRSVPASVCPVPVAERKAKAPGDNCVACHMPHRPSSNVTHVALSDHRVVRHPDRPPPSPPAASQEPIVPFHRNLNPDDPERPRDQGLALAYLATLAHSFGSEQELGFLGERALPLLDGAVARAPDDNPALEARGFTLFARRRFDDALASLDAALALAPEREAALIWAAQAAESKDDLVRAEQYCRRLVEIAPVTAGHRHRLAGLLAKRQLWPESLEAAREAVRLNPFDTPSRALLINALLETGDPAAARVEFETLGTIDPAYRDRLKPWFAERLQRTR